MIDPNIALSVRPAQLDNPLENYGKALSLKSLMLQNQGQQADLSLRDLFQQPGMLEESGMASPKGIAAATAINWKAGQQLAQQRQQNLMQGAQLRNMETTNRFHENQLDKDMRERLTKAHNNQTSAWVSAYKLAEQSGRPEQERIAAAESAWAQQLDQDKSSGLMDGITPQQEAEVRSRKRDISTMLPMVTPPEKVIEQGRKNEADIRAERQITATERRTEALERRPDPVSTVQVADPKDPNKSIVIDARTGKKIGDAPPKQGTDKALPASAAQKLFENQQNLRKAEKALELIGGAGDKDATGWKGYVPEAILQRADPKGVETRAAIADLGSMIIHDRSGAAVTASEYPRLKPFIPLITDDAKTVKTKLARFKQVYQEIVDDAVDFYRDSGYKVPDFKSGEEGPVVKSRPGDGDQSQPAPLAGPRAKPEPAAPQKKYKFSTEEDAMDAFKSGKIGNEELEDELTQIYIKQRKK